MFLLPLGDEDDGVLRRRVASSRGESGTLKQLLRWLGSLEKFDKFGARSSLPLLDRVIRREKGDGGKMRSDADIDIARYEDVCKTGRPPAITAVNSEISTR